MRNPSAQSRTISDRLDLENYPKTLEQFQQGIGRKVQVQPAQAATT